MEGKKLFCFLILCEFLGCLGFTHFLCLPLKMLLPFLTLLLTLVSFIVRCIIYTEECIQFYV